MGTAMINQWRSMMDNLSDIYYLVRLIVHQISIYLRDLILYKFFWVATANEEFNSADPKLHGLTFRNLTTDIVAFSIICIVLFLLVLLASKCEKNEAEHYAAAGIETVSMDREGDPFCRSAVNASAANFFHACGDIACPRGRFLKRNFSEEDMSRVRYANERRTIRISKKSIFGLNVVQPQSSQSTQTTDKIFQKAGQKWLIRRTRSGHVYGKYPV